MTPDPLDRIRSIRDIPALIAYLRDELDWPIEANDFDELTFDYEPEELGIDAHTAAKIEEIKQLRPLAGNQPWGIFFIRFEPKRLPVVVLRRILSQLVVRKRASASKSDLATWNLHDLLFISNYGEDDQRQITFAHFTQDAASGDLPTLKVLGWDDAATALHISHVHHELKEKLHWPEDENDLDSWRARWSSAFTLRHRQVITTSKDLAICLADLARRIRKRAGQVLAVETERGPLRKLHKAFRASLIHDLSEDDFADMYAQTIAYGLLAARVSRPMGIIAENVTDMVPVTNPFLREMLGTFLTIGGRKGKMDFDELGIQDVVYLLNSPDTHMEAILRDFGNRTRQEDPVIHFYELFLAEYDKKMKVKRGVFYTPQPVVSYIVRSVHELLQTEFGLADGLADTTTWGEMAAKPEPSLPSRVGSREGESVPFKIPEGVSPDTPLVQILDIATGTATFLVEVIEVIYKTMTAKWKREKRLELEFDRLWNEYVPKHLLPRLYGYELMMAPYAIAHMKIGLKLFETGYRFGSDERVHVYLTNALEPPQDFSDRLAFDAPALAHEARAVNSVKRDKRFTVVIGNPPYAGISANRGQWITSLIDTYRQIDNIPLKEKKIWVKNDYVKFLRYAQWLVDSTGSGIVGFITDHSYLDSPTFRGMRRNLMQSSSAISVFNLHGNSKRRERTPDGSPDNNVFDITQGVAISLFLKHPKYIAESTIRCADAWGLRETKYNELLMLVPREMNWQPLFPSPPFFEFVPVAQDIKSEYERGRRIDEVFVLGSNGVQTSRDGIVIAATKNELTQRFRWILDQETQDAEIRNQLSVEDRSFWSLSHARSNLANEHDWKANIQPYLYRPFDHHWLFASPHFVHRLRLEVMRHLEKPNIAICVGRAGLVIQGDWNLIFCSDRPCDHNLFYRGSSLNFPLYLYTNLSRHLPDDLFIHENGKRANLAKPFVEELAEIMDIKFANVKQTIDKRVIIPEDIFHYIYAILHSPTYRTRYAEFLKIDFPRLPLTSTIDLFRELARFGSELVALQLVEAPVQTGISIRHDKPEGWTYAYGTPPPVRITFAGPAEPVVDKVGWSDDTVWIAAVKPKKGTADAKVTGTAGFRGVPEEVWNFHIGGYQVCEKWLKDRKGRTLTADDLVHYHRIVVALHETIRLMAEIDRVIAAHGGWPVK